MNICCTRCWQLLHNCRCRNTIPEQDAADARARQPSEWDQRYAEIAAAQLRIYLPKVWEQRQARQ